MRRTRVMGRPHPHTTLETSNTGEGTSAGQTLTAKPNRQTLVHDLMDAILDKGNLNRAYKQVKGNKGAPGVDGMTVGELSGWLKQHKDALLVQLRTGVYHPQAVRAVEIPKPDGSKRRLGIPTVIDRLIQQAILQVLQALYDPTFSASSYGFRPGRSAHMALQAGAAYVGQGRGIVVDMDLEKFFDRVNHDKLMGLLAQGIGDKILLKLIRRYLEAGMLVEGLVSAREEGTPQGGPLSPLLANILLDQLDRELERRGHCFCRYADDCNIYVRSQKAGERVLESISRFIAQKLKLKVNEAKSAVAEVAMRKFLGYQLTAEGGLRLAGQSLAKLKVKVKEITRRNRGVSAEQVIGELNSYLPGWMGYYRLIEEVDPLRRLDSWIRRKVRCYRLKQTKGGAGLRRFLIGNDVAKRQAHRLASSGKGWWCLSRTPQANMAMSNDKLASWGLPSLEQRFYVLNPAKKPPDTLRNVYE
jgi:RNA-directed DNA polymerase